MSGAGTGDLAELDVQIAALGLPRPVAEYRWHPTRRWKFDRCYVAEKIAIEYEGLAWQGGTSRHATLRGYTEDCLKYSEASIAGYCLIRVTTVQVRDGTAADLVRRALERRTP